MGHTALAMAVCNQFVKILSRPSSSQRGLDTVHTYTMPLRIHQSIINAQQKCYLLTAENESGTPLLLTLSLLNQYLLLTVQWTYDFPKMSSITYDT